MGTSSARPLHMPEGDTIYRAARTLDKVLRGQVVTRFESVLPALNRIDEDAPIAGRTVEEVRSSGKNLLLFFSGDLVLRTHMRMNGTWHIYRSGERWRRPKRDMRVLLETKEFAAVGFAIPVAEFIDANRLNMHRELAKLGPDLLETEVDDDEILRRFHDRRELTIAEALLNQRILAGIGNVYKSEVLFLGQVNPFSPVASLDESRLRVLVATARKLMRANVASGSDAGIVTYLGFRRTTRRSDPSERLWVYGRGGRPCRRCGTAIEYRKQGLDARGTYWCPQCQA